MYEDLFSNYYYHFPSALKETYYNDSGPKLRPACLARLILEMSLIMGLSSMNTQLPISGEDSHLMETARILTLPATRSRSLQTGPFFLLFVQSTEEDSTLNTLVETFYLQKGEETQHRLRPVFVSVRLSAMARSVSLYTWPSHAVGEDSVPFRLGTYILVALAR